MKISRIRHAWPEKKGFNLFRRQGLEEFTFLHFWKPVYMLVDGETVLTKPNAVILFDKFVPTLLFARQRPYPRLVPLQRRRLL